MEQLMSKIEKQVSLLGDTKRELERENAVLRRENERLRARVGELTSERDQLDRRLKIGTRHVETAIGRLRFLSEDL